MNNHIKLLNKLCDIYEDKLIYRTIIVTNSKKDSNTLYNILNDTDYSALVVNEIIEDIKYNELDKRIIIISHNKFIKFVEHLNNKYGIDNSSYNLILFSDSINCEQINMLENYYNNLSKKITCC